MIISGLAFSGLALLVWYIITHFVSLGALNAFWIFLALGPIYFLAAGTFRKANDSSSYQSFGSLQFGRVLAIIGLVLFPVLSFSPFFVAWRATGGFWPRTLLMRFRMVLSLRPMMPAWSTVFPIYSISGCGSAKLEIGRASCRERV